MEKNLSLLKVTGKRKSNMQSLILFFQMQYLLDIHSWEAKGENIPEKCHICGTGLSLPFYICKKTEKGFCPTCAWEETSWACGDLKKEHVHFCIKSVKKT